MEPGWESEPGTRQTTGGCGALSLFSQSRQASKIPRLSSLSGGTLGGSQNQELIWPSSPKPVHRQHVDPQYLQTLDVLGGEGKYPGLLRYQKSQEKSG